MPCDIVRLPCGSMSMHRTRMPSSASATAVFSVVVVLATPPFWLAKAITLHFRPASAFTGSPGAGAGEACGAGPGVLFSAGTVVLMPCGLEMCSGVMKGSDGRLNPSRHYSHERRTFLPGRRKPPDAAPIASPARMAALLDKQLVFVTGKGGVGKSTVATALGLLAARRGKRTIIAEVAGQER